MARVLVRTLFRRYENSLKTYPVLSQCVQTGILMTTGDIIAQTVIERNKITQLNYRRTAEFGAMGFVMVGPIITKWYQTLAKICGESGKGKLKKVLLDQGLFAPCFLLVFIPCLGVVQGKKSNEIQEQLKRDYTSIVITNYQLWPAVQVVNFYLVPLRYQVLCCQCVAIIWNTYLSWKTQRTLTNV